MSDEPKRELTTLEGKSSLVPSRARSELVARGRRDAAGIPAHPIDILAALREAIAKNPPKSEEQREAELIEKRRFAEQGDLEAQKELGSHYYRREDYVEAAKWYRKAADRGDYLVQFEIGEMYRQGKGLPQDAAEALYWLRKSAEQGYCEARWAVAAMLYDGEGVPQDYVEAARWIRKEAEEGNDIFQCWLGDLHRDGKGVPRDNSEAAHWYRQSAAMGYADAQHKLGLMYRDGQGVPQNYAQAHMWFDVAASRTTGDEQNKNSQARDALAQKMTPDEIAQSQWLAKSTRDHLPPLDDFALFRR